jgi:hypothetical protein
MPKLMTLAMLTVLPLLTAAAQTTYTLPAGQQVVCRETYTTPVAVETCFNYRALTGSDGSQGWFQCCNIGATAFVFTSPASAGAYCGNPYLPIAGGTPPVWTIGTLANGHTFWGMTCTTAPAQNGPIAINLEITAHSVPLQTRCGKWPCTITNWFIDSFELTLGQPVVPQPVVPTV